MTEYVLTFADFFLGTMGIVLGVLVSLMLFTLLVKTITKVQSFFLKRK